VVETTGLENLNSARSEKKRINGELDQLSVYICKFDMCAYCADCSRRSQRSAEMVSRWSQKRLGSMLLRSLSVPYKRCFIDVYQRLIDP
jgi:hypothetical protein